MYPMTTYSIAGCDPETGEWGVAVQSKFLSVGSLVPFVEPGAGAVASQAKTNSRFGPMAAKLIKEGMTAKETLERLLKEDKLREMRQIGIVDLHGNAAAYSGKENYPYSGHRTGKNFSCQGNVLLGPVVLERMEEAFLNTRGDLALRLLTALTAAQDAGGEKRGQESAALLVRKISDFELVGEAQNYIDLRVDQHLSPIRELRSLLERHRIEYSQNHRDKWYPFEGGTRHRLVEILCETGLFPSVLEQGETVEQKIAQLSEREGFGGAFSEGFINGRLVDWIVNRYYLKQEQLYSGH